MNTPRGRWMMDSTLFADGFDAAILGIIQRCGQPAVVIYDRAKCITLLVEQGMSHEEAEEYFTYNTEGAWVGLGTPGYLMELTKAEIVEMLDGDH